MSAKEKSGNLSVGEQGESIAEAYLRGQRFSYPLQTLSSCDTVPTTSTFGVYYGFHRRSGPDQAETRLRG